LETQGVVNASNSGRIFRLILLDGDFPSNKKKGKQLRISLDVGGGGSADHLKN